MSKAKVSTKKNRKAIVPKAIRNVSDEETETFDSDENLIGGEETQYEERYSVRIDSKRLDNRTAEQVIAIVSGALGSVKRITIDKA